MLNSIVKGCYSVALFYLNRWLAMVDFILGVFLMLLLGVSLWIKAVPWIIVGFLIVGIPICIYMSKPYKGKKRYK